MAQGDPGLGKLQYLIHIGLIEHAEEIHEPALAAAFRQADVSVDLGLESVYIRAVAFGTLIYTQSIGLEIPRHGNHQRINAVKLAAETLSVIRSNLSILSSMKYVRLQAKFPGHLKEVTAEMNQETRAKIFKVVFRNGHVLSTTEPEIETDDFYAKCLMVYDLPNL